MKSHEHGFESWNSGTSPKPLQKALDVHREAMKLLHKEFEKVPCFFTRPVLQKKGIVSSARVGLGNPAAAMDFQ